MATVLEEKNDLPPVRDRKRGALVLLNVSLLIAALWLFVFPAVSRDLGFEEKHAERKRQGIHVSAMFYTELEVDEKHDSLERLKEQNPWALWLPWAYSEQPPPVPEE